MPTDQLKGVNTPNGQFDVTQLMPLDGTATRFRSRIRNGNNVINPCTGGTVYQGELFDPATQTTVGGQMCRFPFATDNVIPAGKIDQCGKESSSVFSEAEPERQRGHQWRLLLRGSNSLSVNSHLRAHRLRLQQQEPSDLFDCRAGRKLSSLFGMELSGGVLSR